MASGRPLVAIALMALTAAATPADPIAKAGLTATADKPLNLDFNGDGRMETVRVATVANPAGGARFDSPWGRSVRDAPGPVRRGEKVIAIAGIGTTVWALRDAVYSERVALRHGKVPAAYRECWNNPRRDGLAVLEEGVGGVIMWSGKRFDWIQCGD